MAAKRKAQIRLTCEYLAEEEEEHAFPSQEIIVPYSEETELVNVVRYDLDGKLALRLESEGLQPAHQEEGEVVAKFQIIKSGTLLLLLESFAEKMIIKSPSTGVLTRVLREKDGVQPTPLPRSEPEMVRCLVPLRSDDVVFFGQCVFTVKVAVEDADDSEVDESAALEERYVTAEEAKGAVQVRSSDVESDGAESKSGGDIGDEEVESETDDEDDLDRRHNGEQTPKATRVMEDGVPTIKETPNQRSDDAREDVPFSTAPNAIVADDDDEPSTGADSPSARALTKAGSKSKQNAALCASTLLDDDAVTSVAPKRTYGRKQPSARRTRRVTAGALSNGDDDDNDNGDKASKPEELNDSAGSGDEKDVETGSSRKSISKADGQHDESPTPEEGRSRRMWYDAPVGTGGRSGKKRKSTEIVGIDDEDASASKRRKTASPTPRDAVHDEDDDDATPSTSKALPRKKGRRLPKAALPDSQNIEEEIDVAARPFQSTNQNPNMSPSVVVTAPTLSSAPIRPFKVSTIILSNTILKQPMKKWLDSKGVKIKEDVPSSPRAHFVCVVQAGKLERRPKVLRSLIMNKPVVIDTWLIDSKAQGEFLDPTPYIHKDIPSNTNINRKKLFTGKTLLFTKQLVQNYGGLWDDIQKIAKEAGASNIRQCCVPDDGPWGEGEDEEMNSRVQKTLFFGDKTADDHVKSLMGNYRREVYHKDFLAYSIVTGSLDGAEMEGMRLP